MPSAEHESPVALAKLDPDLMAWLLGHIFDVEVPDYHHARSQAHDVRVMVPRTYHADGMMVFCDAADQPVLAAVLEVQRGRDPTKLRTWKLYVAQLEAEPDISVALVVYCPSRVVARWYQALFESDGLCLQLRPLIFRPEDVPWSSTPTSAGAIPRSPSCRPSAMAGTPRSTACSRRWPRLCKRWDQGK